jgi:hypothetical protein
MKDWTGNTQSVHAPNKRNQDAQEHDYYATDPRAVELLLENETFTGPVWEPACGEGHISKVLRAHGLEVYSTDLVDRRYGAGGVDFLTYQGSVHHCDIITNPPYKYAREFVEKALDIVAPGRKVAMFLKLTFLEGQGRRDLFRNNPPETVYVSSARLECGKNGVFTGSSAVAYCWIVWKKGHYGPTHLKWIN